MRSSDDRIGGATVLALAAMGVAIFVIANDFTALSVAIPDIEHDLSSDLTTAQWVINAYAMVFGVLIVTGGRVADLYGRRRTFMVGTAIFATFSLLGGLAPGIGLLIACRALMGVGGAMMWPAILGMVYAILPDDKAGIAGGLVLGVAGLGNAVGPLLGGVLTDVASWRWIFFLNVPIAAFAIWVTSRLVPETTGVETDRRMDFRGVAVVTAGIVSILLALDEGADVGWTEPGILALFIVGGALLVGFVALEMRTGPYTLVPRAVLANRDFAAACIVVLLMSAIFFAALLYLPQYLTKELGYSALRAGAGLLPMMGVFAVTSFIAGPLYERLGPKLIVSLGALFLAAGMAALSMLHSGTTYGALVPGMVVLGLGVGVFYSSVTTAGVTALDPSRASLAGGIIYMCQIAGGAMGLGLNTAIVTSGANLPAGISAAFRVDAALAVVGLFVAIALIGGRVRGLTHVR